MSIAVPIALCAVARYQGAYTTLYSSGTSRRFQQRIEATKHISQLAIYLIKFGTLPSKIALNKHSLTVHV